MCVVVTNENKVGKSDVREEINNPVSHELIHVPIRLPLFRCFVHIHRLPQGLHDSENQKCNTENKSRDYEAHVDQRWDVDQ